MELNEKILRKNKNNKKYIWKHCPSNILAAFEAGRCRYVEEYPIALKPQHIHPRVTAQKGCFTVHGKNQNGIQDMFIDKKLGEIITEDYRIACYYEVNNELYQNTSTIVENLLFKYSKNYFKDIFLKKYKIDPDIAIITKLMNELKIAGVGYSTLFPDLDGLAKELSLW